MQYSDYELYQLLEDNDCETTEENLNILKEGLEDGTYLFSEDGTLYGALYEYFPGMARIEGKKIARLSAIDPEKRTEKQNTKLANKYERYEKHLNRGAPSATRASKAITAEANKIAAKHAEAQKASAAIAKARDTITQKHEMENGIDSIGKDAVAKRDEYIKKEAKKKKAVTESFSDYELYQILDSHDFEATNENLDILREDMESAKILFLSVDDVILTEDMNQYDIYAQILDQNGFTITESNYEILKSAIENGHVFLVEAKNPKPTSTESSETGKPESTPSEKSEKDESESTSSEKTETGKPESTTNKKSKSKSKEVLKALGKAALIAGSAATGGYLATKI